MLIPSRYCFLKLNKDFDLKNLLGLLNAHRFPFLQDTVSKLQAVATKADSLLDFYYSVGGLVHIKVAWTIQVVNF